MDINVCKIDGEDVLKDGVSGIHYGLNCNWRRLVGSNQTENLDGKHGRYTSPVYARYRQVILEGYIDRVGNTLEQEATEYLEELFALSGGNIDEATKVLYIKDVYDREWTINVIVKDPIEIVEESDEFEWAGWKWRVVLESTTAPEMKSLAEILVEGIEGEFGGMTLPCVLPEILDYYYNIIECETIGNVASKPKFVITATGNIDSPLKIKNLNTGEFFGLDINAVEGDVIVIDTLTKTATKNGVNVLANRITGSKWLTIKNTTFFGVEDLDGAIPEEDISVAIYFRHYFL